MLEDESVLLFAPHMAFVSLLLYQGATKSITCSVVGIFFGYCSVEEYESGKNLEKQFEKS